MEALSAVRSMEDWAEATRRIDYHFGTGRGPSPHRPPPGSHPERRDK
ncbi:hypothetical protein [Nonomuraea salmonea]